MRTDWLLLYHTFGGTVNSKRGDFRGYFGESVGFKLSIMSAICFPNGGTGNPSSWAIARGMSRSAVRARLMRLF